jgi:zinc transporter ZupT
MPKSLSFVLALAASILTAVAFFIGLALLVFRANQDESFRSLLNLMASYRPGLFELAAVLILSAPALAHRAVFVFSRPYQD